MAICRCRSAQTFSTLNVKCETQRPAESSSGGTGELHDAAHNRCSIELLIGNPQRTAAWRFSGRRVANAGCNWNQYNCTVRLFALFSPLSLLFATSLPATLPTNISGTGILLAPFL